MKVSKPSLGRSAVRAGLMLALAVAQASVVAKADEPFLAHYDGTFHISFGTGSGGSHQLAFSGQGRGRHLGRSRVVGQSEMAPGSSPVCFEITNDFVTLTAANGDELHLVNSGEDCLQATATGQTVVRGAGRMTIVGGTGRFSGATGEGTWLVDAPVTALGPAGADGTFDLVFGGRLL